MKTISLFTGLALLILIVCDACRKSNAHTGSGYWYIYGQKHLVNYTRRVDSAGILILTGMESLPTSSHPFVNSISVFLGSTPTAGTTSFQPVNPYPNWGLGALTMPAPGQFWADGASITPRPGDIDSCTINGYTFISSQWAEPTDTITFSDQWNPAGKATVSVINNKISIALPPMRGSSYNRCGIDSPSMSGFIVEQ